MRFFFRRRDPLARTAVVGLTALSFLAPFARSADSGPAQKHPALLLTSFGEVTDDARKTNPVSPSAPGYYVVASAQYRPSGHLPKDNPLEPEKIAAMLRHSLAESGYQPADETHPATLGLVYFWGPHAVVDTSAATQEQALRNLLDRAALIAGDKFASDLATAMRESARNAEASAPASLGGGGLGAAQGLAAASAMADPLILFRRREAQNDTLLDQASTSCYYIVISAYDYKSLATPQKKLLWRVRATANSQGVGQGQAFPFLVTFASHFLGQETPKPKIVRLRANEPLPESEPAAAK